MEAVNRLYNPVPIDGELMLITAVFGLGCNILNLIILQCCFNEKPSENQRDSIINKESLLGSFN